jgi:inosine-uridine nucleoside N-ribohydrolase
VCTGALTNVALLVLMYPEVVPMVAITIMGGAMGIGNTGPVAEFNIQVKSSSWPHTTGLPLHCKSLG